jgi:site-specific recombinase XerD
LTEYFQISSNRGFGHAFASLQVLQGRDLRTIQELLGHTEIKTTQIYAHLTHDHLAEAAEINLGPVDLGD